MNREKHEKKQWVEPVAALLMALATLSTAWCSFESAAWTRKSNRLMNEFNALERKAVPPAPEGAEKPDQESDVEGWLKRFGGDD